MWVRWRGAPSTRRQGYAEEEGRGARDAGGVERRLEQMGVRRSPPSGPHGRLRTFFAVAISDSISSVDRLLASSNLGNAIMRAAAERATSGRVECTHTRSPLALATSASSIKNSCMLRPGERGERRRRPVWPFVVGFRCLLSPWAAPRCQMPTSRTAVGAQVVELCRSVQVGPRPKFRRRLRVLQDSARVNRGRDDDRQ